MINNMHTRIPAKGAQISTRRQRKGLKAQSALEFALVTVCVVAALLAMGTYIRRNMQGRLRENVEPLGKQFDPVTTEGTYTTTSNSTSRLWTRTQSEPDLLNFDLNDDGELIDITFGSTSNNTVMSVNGTTTGHEITN